MKLLLMAAASMGLVFILLCNVFVVLCAPLCTMIVVGSCVPYDVLWRIIGYVMSSVFNISCAFTIEMLICYLQVTQNDKELSKYI